ncbi:MAG TPA: nitrous oxide reductase accessory protein NosL [Geobacteraceae bacterium]
MKRRVFLLTLLCLALAGAVVAADTGSGDMDTSRNCTHCGMDRKAYGYGRMLIQYKDGGQVGVCSLHCAVTEMNTGTGRAIKALLVADRDSRALIPVEQATWVVGGKKRGVMTTQPKWAFATLAAAQAFVSAHGGAVASWAEALAAARAEPPR